MESQRTLLYPQDRAGEATRTAPPGRIAPRSTDFAPPEGHHRLHSHHELVLGRYRLLERLGAGGFGVVWRAHDELLHRQVAVKRVWLGPDGDTDRATREALAAARLSHPAIVALHEAAAVQGAFYLISELVEGDTLARLIADGELDDARALAIGLSIARALAHAHARGVIHRDIKPQNVLVPRDASSGGEAAKLTDFGGASLADEDALTRTGDVLGTLAYMAPEQSEGREVGEAADLYALALVLYETLGGVNPVRGPTPAATAKRIGSRLPPLARHRRDLPRALTGALDAALSPAPEDRGSLQTLAAALEQALIDCDPGDDPRLPERHRPRERTPRPLSSVLGEVPAWSLPEDGLARTAKAPRAPAGPRTAGAHVSGRREPRGRHERLRRDEQLRPHDPLRRDDAREQPAPSESQLQAGPVARLALPRAVWIACTVLLVGWQASLGRPGLALVLLAAFTPLLVVSWARPPGAGSVAVGWLGCALAPVLGLAGLAGAFPAIAGQATRWRTRALAAGLGYWWLVLAEPLLGRRLWLGAPAGTPARATWEPSLASAASHVLAPALAIGVLLGALLWSCGAAVLPWLVRGRNAVVDVVAVTTWSAAIAAAEPMLDAGLRGTGAHPSPHGAVVGAVVGGLVAVAARALRGPA